MAESWARDVQDRLDGTEFGTDTRLVINATGPSVDHLRRMEDKSAATSIRLSKGTHVVLKRKAPWKAAMATPIDKYHLTFALPWEDQLLLGTTDKAGAKPRGGGDRRRRAAPPYDADGPRSRHGRGPRRRPGPACTEGLMR